LTSLQLSGRCLAITHGGSAGMCRAMATADTNPDLREALSQSAGGELSIKILGY
jgi:hypothetical protein